MARQPKNPFHPGEILLEEFLAPNGVTQAPESFDGVA
jgi:plasmid maintenance system antidote protein VapI